MKLRSPFRRRRPRLILHVGTHKTGSTSIQKVLREHRDSDRARGLFYPFPDELTPIKPHHRFAHGLASASSKYVTLSSAFVDHIRDHMHDDDVVVISSEPIYRHAYEMSWSTTTWRDDAAYWAARRQYLQNVADALEEFDVSVLLFLRDKDSFIESMAGERSRTGDWSGTGQDLAEQYPQLLEYDRQIELFEQILGPVTVVDYDDALRNGGSVIAFYRAMGFEPPPEASSVRERVSEPD